MATYQGIGFGRGERSVREWLRNQAAGGYITYDAESDRYTLPDEHALALVDEDSPFYVLGISRRFLSLPNPHRTIGSWLCWPRKWRGAGRS